MSNVLGELFGDIANAIREKTGDTATMKPAEFPSKISGIEVGGGGVSETVILAEQNFTSVLDSYYGYMNTARPSAAFVVGQTYKVALDNDVYTCKGEDASFFIDGGVFFGNGADFGLSGNGEKFVALYNPQINAVTIIYLEDTAPTDHTVTIYHVTEESGGGGEIIDGVDPYYQGLAQALITRNAEYLSEYPTILPMKGFVTSTGGVLATVAPYAFAGFKDVEKITISDTLFVNPYAFAGNKKLKIIDITAPRFNTGSVAFYGNSLYECSALQSVIVRDGGIGLEYVNFFKNDMSGADYGGVGANDTFCVYIPSAYYDSVVANVNAATNIAVPTSRYRKLEDYPAINNWNKTFTVNFYDGDKLVESKTVMYGQTASSSYSKSNYRLVGWNPEPVNVMEDMDCYGTWVPINFSDASWSEIVEAAQTGRIGEIYKVGDEKEITLTHADGTTETNALVIAGFDDLVTADGANSNMVLVTKYALNKKMAMHSKYAQYGTNYEKTEMHTYLCGDVLNGLPESLQAGIKEIKVRSSNTAKVWLLSLENLQRTKTNFVNTGPADVALPLFTSNAARIRTTADGTAVDYWTRNRKSNTSYWAYMTTSGDVYGSSSSSGYASDSQSLGVVFGLCI